MIGSPDEAEELAVTVEDNGGVYVVPALPDWVLLGGKGI